MQLVNQIFVKIYTDVIFTCILLSIEWVLYYFAVYALGGDDVLERIRTRFVIKLLCRVTVIFLHLEVQVSGWGHTPRFTCNAVRSGGISCTGRVLIAL